MVFDDADVGVCVFVLCCVRACVSVTHLVHGDADVEVLDAPGAARVALVVILSVIATGYYGHCNGIITIIGTL